VYADLRDLCEHHGITTLEEKGAIHLESIKLCNSLPGNVKFNVIAECAVIDAINNGRVNVVVNIRTLTSEPELTALRVKGGALTHFKIRMFTFNHWIWESFLALKPERKKKPF
jgi:hypothetical protein